MSYKMHSTPPRRRWKRRNRDAVDAIMAHALALPIVVVVIVVIVVALRLAWPS